MTLIERLETAEGPSRELFLDLFNALCPEPPKPRFLSWEWWFVSDHSRWQHQEYHVHHLMDRGRWNELAIWLSGIPEDRAPALFLAALKAKGIE